MGRGIVKLADNEYVEWSTVVDAPVSWVMAYDEALEAAGDPARIVRADVFGTSYLSPPWSLRDLLNGNRAGPDESEATLSEIRKLYRPPKPWWRRLFGMVAGGESE